MQNFTFSVHLLYFIYETYTMNKPIRILFVCKGNIFRSMTAEYMMKKYLKQHKITDFEVSSAGIVAKFQEPDPFLLQDLKQRKIDISVHRQRKLTKEILDQQDIVIAMGQNHKDFIWKKRKRRVFLFNELAYNKKTPVRDVEEVMSPEQITTESRDKYEDHVVKHIQKWMPAVVKSIKERYCLFVDLMDKRLCHRNGMPFIPLYETKHTIAFMSIAIPQYEDGHVLIIPKKRFRTIEEMSVTYLKDLMNTVQIIGTVIKQTHTGYNLLLNNGEDAGQYILHVHFHLIPRKEHDHITIEFFKKQKLSPKVFIAYNMLLKNNIKKFLQDKKNT